MTIIWLIILVGNKVFLIIIKVESPLRIISIITFLQRTTENDIFILAREVSKTYSLTSVWLNS